MMRSSNSTFLKNSKTIIRMILSRTTAMPVLKGIMIPSIIYLEMISKKIRNRYSQKSIYSLKTTQSNRKERINFMQKQKMYSQIGEANVKKFCRN